MSTLVLSILLVLEPGAAATRRPTPSPPPSIDWPDFFASVTTQGVVFSEPMKALEGKRVRLRGYSVTHPPVPGGLLLTRSPFFESDPHGPGAELDVPFDTVGIVWRERVRLPPTPSRPTVEGTLRLGNRSLSGNIVVLTLEDAVPVYSPRTEKGKTKSKTSS